MSPVIGGRLARTAATAVRRNLASLSLVALFGPARTSWAEEEVRIAIVTSKASIRVEADQLALFDGDVGDRVGHASGEARLAFQAASGKIRVDAEGLTRDQPNVEARRFLIEAPSGIRVDGRLYLGRVAVETISGGDALVAINRLPLETYLLGIVGAEMNPGWPIEALKAQAVAARTYAMHRRMMMRAADKPYDLESSVLSQVYKGADRIRPPVVTAVAETRGEVVSHRHMLVEALFHSTCGGQTHSAESAFGHAVPYLMPRECRWCDDSSYRRWTVRLPLKEVGKRLERAKLVRGRLDRIERERARGPVEARGKRSWKLEPKAVRQALGYSVLYSTSFVAKTRGNTVVFEGRGFGHLVGMCQWGARGQAEQGRSYREILAEYYSGAEVKRIY